MQFDPAHFLQPHLAFVALLSFLGCLALIRLARVFPRLQGRADDANAVQSMHIGLTPRVGGVAIFGALACSVLLAPEASVRNYVEIILGTSVVFFVGLREDLGYHVTPTMRLLTVVASSLLVIVLLGVWLPRIGMPYVDQMFKYWIFGVPFTLLITAGVSNGFNLIDGVNGLAAMTAMTSAIAIALIAHQSGFQTMVTLSMIVAAATLGFFVVNYPFGKIFLGDAGAYTVGFVLVWFGIGVLINSGAVSPWAILLAFFWPLADTVLAMYRRSRGSRAAMLPDRLHFHQLVMRGLEISVLGRGRRHLSNPLTTLILSPFVIAPQLAGVLLWNSNRIAFFGVLAFLAAFFVSYAALFKVIRRAGRRPAPNAMKR